MKNNTKLIVPIVVIALALFTLTPVRYMVTGGLTVLSIDRIDFESKNPHFNGPAWVVLAKQGGLGQTLLADIDKEDAKQPDGKRPEHDLSITITNSWQACEYTIKPNPAATGIYKYEMHEWSCLFLTAAEAAQHCPNKCINYGRIPWSKGDDLWDMKCFCIDEIPLATNIAYNTISAPVVHTKATIVAERDDGSTRSLKMDTITETQECTSDFCVELVGYFDANRDCPDPQENLDVYAYYDNGWKLGSASQYEDYKSTWTNNIDKIQYGSYSEAKTAIEQVNNAALRALNTRRIGNLVKDGPQEALLAISLDNPVKYPAWLFVIDADWVGVYQPTPKPKIEAPSSIKIEGTGQACFVVKNTGDETGNIVVEAECGQRVQAIEHKEVTLAPGESKTVCLEIVALETSDEPLEEKCTAKASSLQYTSTDGFTVNIVPQHECYDAGKAWCDGDTIKECSEYYRILEHPCPAGQTCEYVDGIPRCVTPSQDDKQEPMPPAQYCGDGVCDPGETTKNCPQDCGQPGGIDTETLIAILSGAGIVVMLVLLKKKGRI